MAKRAELPAKVDYRDFANLLKQLHSESDRGAALVAAAWLDDCLGEFIKSRCIADAGAVNNLLNGPLRDFGSRIRAAYCFGFIGKIVFDELQRIQTVRNHFAHTRSELTFESEPIRCTCSQFESLRLFREAGGEPIVPVKHAFIRVAGLMLFELWEGVADAAKADVSDEAWSALMKQHASPEFNERVQKLLDYARTKKK